MEQTYEMLNAIIIAHISSDIQGELPPTMLNSIRIFTEYTFILLSWLPTYCLYAGHSTRYIPL
jgi:hypothetical protein